MNFVECIICNCEHVPEGGKDMCKLGSVGSRLPHDCDFYTNRIEVMVV